MTTAKPTMDEAFSRTKPEKPKKREKIYNAKATPGRRGKRGITVFVSPATLDDLNAIKDELSDIGETDVLLKDVVAEGLNLVLQKYGRKATA